MNKKKRLKAKMAWAILYRGQIGSYICIYRDEVEGNCGKGEKVVAVRVTAIGSPYTPKAK